MYEGQRPWHHPVFGTGKWVVQPHRGFLTEVADRGRPTVLKQIADVCDEIGRKLD
jgi:hypothetical protein